MWCFNTCIQHAVCFYTNQRKKLKKPITCTSPGKGKTYLGSDLFSVRGIYSLTILQVSPIVFPWSIHFSMLIHSFSFSLKLLMPLPYLHSQLKILLFTPLRKPKQSTEKFHVFLLSQIHILSHICTHTVCLTICLDGWSMVLAKASSPHIHTFSRLSVIAFLWSCLHCQFANGHWIILSSIQTCYDFATLKTTK